MQMAVLFLGGSIAGFLVLSILALWYRDSVWQWADTALNIKLSIAIGVVCGWDPVDLRPVSPLLDIDDKAAGNTE